MRFCIRILLAGWQQIVPLTSGHAAQKAKLRCLVDVRANTSDVRSNEAEKRQRYSRLISWHSTAPTRTSSPTSARGSSRGCPLEMRACTRVHDKLSCTRLKNYTIDVSLISVSVFVSVSVPWNSSYIAHVSPGHYGFGCSIETRLYATLIFHEYKL